MTTKTPAPSNSKAPAEPQTPTRHAIHNGHVSTQRPTVEERWAKGRALREKTPRSSHAFWAEPPTRSDPIAILQAQATTRLPELVPIRYARMRVSPFAFLRGSAAVMAGDLALTPTTGIQTQLCGDAHCANFGIYASPERVLLFDINDLDETYPGPWEWDVKRLAASLYVAGRGNGFSEAENRAAVLAMARSYRQAMVQFANMPTLDVWYARVSADDLLAMLPGKQARKVGQKVFADARRHTSAQAFSKLTEVEDGRLIIANDPPLIMRITEEVTGDEIRTLFEEYTRSLRGAQRRVLDRFEIRDLALKVVGVGSVGTRCFIVLLTGRDADDPLFLQVKEAEASVLAAHLPSAGYRHQGERVVSGQELMQPASDSFLGWMTGPAGRYFYWRQLRDMKGSVEIESLRPPGLALYGELCGHVLARAHARASGNSVEIAAYLGQSDSFDQAIGDFAQAYANQTERDYQLLLAAIKSGRIVAASAG